MRQDHGYVVYITPEIAIDQRIPSYSGGLGYLAGGAAISAKTLGIPMVIISMLYRKGYCTQKCNQQGMIIEDIDYSYEGVLEKTNIKFQVNICSSSIWVEVLKYAGGKYNSADIYFLTTDIDENDYLSRLICSQLYGGNLDRRIAQAIVLGKGSVETCKRLNIPVHCWHINESHGVLAAVELAQAQGFENVSAKTIFTTHTPVAAGNPRYRIDDLCRMNGFQPESLERWGGSPFDMAAAGIRLSRKSNAVSKKHLSVCMRMWHWLFDPNSHGSFDQRFTYVTNGVSQDYWQYPEFKKAGSTEELRAAKQVYKRKMIDYIRKQSVVGKYFSENIFTVVWARRFAGYKRPRLMFDVLSDWLHGQLNNNRIQLVFAGKPHPDDRAMVDDWNFIFNKSREWPNLTILPGYDLEMSKILKGGADLWLNTPRAPFEACGTSGMSANMNGALHMSTPDGWAAEADKDNCFIFGSESTMESYGQNRIDADGLRENMDMASDMYYRDNLVWYGKAMSAKLEAETRWTSDRMMREYAVLYGISI